MLIDANTGAYLNAALSEVMVNPVQGMFEDAPDFADVYDLAGRVVMKGASVADLDALQKGIYIRAGKKFIKR